MSARLSEAPAPSPDQPTTVFLALKPAERDGRRILDAGNNLSRRGIISGQLMAAPRLHLTILPLWSGYGRAPTPLLRAACCAVGDIRFPGFEVVMDQIVTFRSAKRRRPVVMTGSDGSAGALALFLALRDVLVAKGMKRDRPGAITPHLTLLWGRGPEAVTPIDPIAWAASDLVLVESWYGAARHVELASWPLD